MTADLLGKAWFWLWRWPLRWLELAGERTQDWARTANANNALRAVGSKTRFT